MSSKTKRKAKDSKPGDLSSVLKRGAKIAGFSYHPERPGEDFYKVTFDDGTVLNVDASQFAELNARQTK